MTTTKIKTICGIKFNKETEKALLIDCCVSWNGNCHSKSIWFPKSVARVVENKFKAGQMDLEVADWFVSKLEVANSYKGYGMYFEGIC